MDGEWWSMETAPKDGSPLLLLLRDDLPGADLKRWRGLRFVGSHTGVEPDGFDIGWAFAAPVGMGGFPDAWFVGWHPLPDPPSDAR